MVPSISGPPTLRRSCQGCIRSKRRCDQRWPHCTRCQTRKLTCEYINVPLPTGTGREPPSKTRKLQASARPVARLYTPAIQLPLPLEIKNDYRPNILAFLVSGISSYPVSFVNEMKTHFIHPEIWNETHISTPPPPIREIHTLCHLYAQKTTDNTFSTTLKHNITSLLKQINHPTNFSDLLTSTQALLLAQSMLILTENLSTPYSEATSATLLHTAQKLWHQVPIQLPNSLGPRRAWLFAETVRRTIIVAFLLRSVYSLVKRGFSVRTPFVDSLPFDMRTELWDCSHRREIDEGVEESNCSTDSIVSLHRYSGLLEAGLVHGVSEFGGLILAACRGKAVGEVPYPANREYEYPL
ncbi:hypothetical protein BJX70DRAFT_373900 [Aspergillus crustosus]